MKIVAPSEPRTKPICEPMLRSATLDLYRENAFRITGLAVDASTREMNRHADKLKMMEELGAGKSVHVGGFAREKPPSVDEIRTAIQQLKDPEQRIVHEFFWFWPERFGESANDPAIQALANGDREAALEIWSTKESHRKDGIAAMHNVAVLWHIVALEWEDYADGAPIDAECARKIETYWRDSFQRWEALAVDDGFWNMMAERAKQLDDARLTSGFVRRMRATLPQALDKINAELAVRHVEKGRIEMARLHVRFMQETNAGLDDTEKTAEAVLAPAKVRIEQQLKRAQERAMADPRDAHKTLQELLQHARATLALFDLFFGRESEIRNDLSNEVANLANRLAVAYRNATGDDQACLEALRTILPFAASIDLMQVIEKNIAGISGDVAFKKVEPIYVLLKGLQESREIAQTRLWKFETQIAPAIKKAPLSSSESQAKGDLENAAASVLRGVSLDAWNKHQDLTTALAACELALNYAHNRELKQRLTEDHTVLLGQKAQRDRQSKASLIKSLVWLAIVILLVFFVAHDSGESNSSKASKSPRPTSENEEQQTYLVAKARLAELDRDAEIIGSEKLNVEAYHADVETLGAQIERDRLYLNRYSQAAVDEFNRKVARHSAMLREEQLRTQALNNLVDAYNTKLRLYGR